MAYLVINFLLYLTFLLYTLRKDKFVASNLYMYIIWLTGAFFSILYYDTPFFKLVGHVADLSLFPFLYLFGLFVCFYESVKLKDNIGKVHYCRSPLIKPLILFLAITAVVPFIENVKEIFMGRFDITEISDIKSEYTEGDLDNRYYMSWLGARIQGVSSRFYFLSPIFLFYYLSISKKINKYICVGLVLSVLNPVLNGIIIGGRGVMASTVLYLVLLFFYFRNTMPLRTKKIIQKVIYGIGIFIGVFFILTTIYRFTSSRYDSFTLTDWIVRYFGESFSNFNTECWHFTDNTWGRNTLANIFEKDGLRHWMELEKITHIRMNVYFTMFGDLLLDFGYYLAPVIVLILCLICRSVRPHKGDVSLVSLIMFSLFSYIFIEGLFIWPLINRNTAALTTIVIAALIKFSEKKWKFQ